jgi:gentisate 1,2-dioxygenase
MRPGDFVTTPGWTWHDHGNLGSEPVVWLDGLDTAFAALFERISARNIRRKPSP